jgi:hypothetical protein
MGGVGLARIDPGPFPTGLSIIFGGIIAAVYKKYQVYSFFNA